MVMEGPLCELHAHFGGCLRADDIIAVVGGRTVDWSAYEAAYERTYGRSAPLRAILADLRAGDPTARDRFRELFVFSDAHAGDFDRFSASFGLISCASALASPDLASHVPRAAADELAFVARRLADDCRAHGIGHAEIRFFMGAARPAPVRREVYRLLLAAFAAESRDGVVLRLAPSLPREAPWEAWRVVQELALGEHGEVVTAVDFCHVEEGHPPKAQRALADDLRRFNAEHPRRALALLYHVGESYRDKSLESAVRWCHEASVDLGAHRLGHAIALGVCPTHHGSHRRRERVAERRDQIAYDLAHAEGLRAHGVRIDLGELRREDAVLAGRGDDDWIDLAYDAARLDAIPLRQAYACARIAAAGTVAEICPTSNRRIAGFLRPEVHQVHRFRERGLPFVVGADDPGILDTTLRDELEWLGTHARLDRTALSAVARRAWDCRSEVMAGRLALDAQPATANASSRTSPA